ncbi:MAG TPA: histidine kinase [Rhodobacterales bacterium]|nr:histidine kinase [Rhodobacterales bacterium]
MNGKIVGSFVVLSALIFGAVVYYTQVYAFYEEVSADTAHMTLVNIATGQPEPVLVDGFEGIDGSSSPIRYRACFTLPQRLATLTETYTPYPTPTPLIAPGWFDCFDAEAIGAALERGEAMAFLSQTEIADGVDRVVAVFPDGRAFAWHQLNEKYQD